jgi:hypothetical protein
MYNSKEVMTPEHETDLKLDGAHSLMTTKQGMPELLYHKYGQGTAFLLNYFPNKYPEEKLNGDNGPALNKFRKLLKKAGIEPAIVMTNLSGQSAKNISKYVFTKNGTGTRLMGLLPDKSDTAKAVTIHLNKEENIYDIRNKKYLGKDRTFKIKIQPQIPVLLGLTNGKIDHINVDAPSKATLGDKIDISFHISGEGLQSLRSIAYVDVFNPHGKKVPVYGGNYNITDSSGRIHFKTALNDPSGRWKIKITEAISGVEKTVTVNIQQ